MMLNKSSLDKLHTCENSLILLAIEAAKESPYGFIITSGMRTIAEQQKLFAQGRTTPGKKVTNCDGIKKKSKHNYSPSKAFDFAVLIDGTITWDFKYYLEMAKYFEQIAKKYSIKISCGAFWKKPDGPHIEV